METIPQIAASLQMVLTQVADELGRETGFIQRQRKLTGASFAQSLIFGWLANPQSSMEELSQSAANIGVSISRQGLDERFSPQAAHFLKRLVEEMVKQVVSVPTEPAQVLAQFQGIYLLDSTIIELPESLKAEWQGCQGSSLKVSVS